MSDGGPIEVSGGAGGVTAGYADMVSFADRIDAAADNLLATSGRLTGLLVDGDILAAAVLCPGEVALVEAALTEVAAETALRSAGMEVQARYLRGAVEALQGLDVAMAQMEDTAWDVAGWTAGAVLPFAAAAGATVLVSNPALRALLLAHRDDLAPTLQETLYDNPWLQEALTRMAPGMVQSTAFTLSALLGPQGPLLLGSLTDGAWPSGDYTTSVAGLMNLANKFGALEDTGDFSIGPASVPTSIDIRPDQAVQGIFEQQTAIGDKQGTIQIIALDNGSYVVQVPGTQEWGATRGDNPVDLTTNVGLMAGRDTRLEGLIADAMSQAGIPPDAPVMLTGHSQGGITAAALASDPSFRDRYNVRSIVTGGSPIARYDIPDDISVLSMEHDQDPVPRLDGLDNPDRPNWVTVRRDLSDIAGTNSDGVRDPFQAHATQNYSRTGREIDQSNDPSLTGWHHDNAPFFGPGDATSYEVEKTP